MRKQSDGGAGRTRHRPASRVRLSLLLVMLLAWPLAAAAQDADALAAQAEAHAAAGDSAAAAAAYAAAIAADPARRSEWRRVLADHLAWSGRATEAAPIYREVAEDPALPEQERALARRRLGLALLWSGEPAAAVPWLRRALASELDDPELRRSLADALAASGRAERDVEAGAELLRQAGRVDPSRARALALESADRLLFGRRYEAAEAAYREFLGEPAVDREDRRAALLGLSRSFAWNERPRDALPVYDRLVEEEPEFVPGWIGRGQALAATGDPAAALRSFETALRLDPDDPEAIRGVSDAELGLGRPRRARERLAPLLADDVPDPDTRLVEARIDIRRGRPDRSEAIVRDLLADEDRLQSWQLAGTTRLLDQLMLERMPLGELTASQVWRSDDVRIGTMSSRASFMINAGLTTLGLQARVRSIEDPSDPDVTIASIGAFGRARIDDDIELATSVFLHFPEGSGEAEPAVTHDTSVTFFPEDGLRLGLRLERRYVDETSRPVQDGIFANDLGAEAEFLPGPDTRLGARATASVLSDDNRRVWGSLEASRRVLTGDHQAWLGLRGTAFGYRRTEEAYWSPVSYGAAEINGQTFGPIGAGWRYNLSGWLGYAASSPGDNGGTLGLRGEISRDVLRGGRATLFAAYQASLARTEEAGGIVGDFGAAWRRSEIGARVHIRF